MKMNYKILAVAVVALFAATAFVAFAGEETDAANKEYNIYFEVLTADGKVTASDWKSFEYDGTNADWAAKVAPLYKEFVQKNASKARDVDAYTVTANSTGISFGYDGKPYTYWAGTFYNKSGSWSMVFDTSEDYTGSNTASVRVYETGAYGVFIDATELPVGADATKYYSYEASWAPGTTMYTLLPSSAVDGYSSGDMTLYIIIAVIVVIVIVAAVVVVKKKKTA